MKALMIIVTTILLGCRADVRVVAPAAVEPVAGPVKYCFTAVVEFNEQHIPITGCTQSAAMCLRAVAVAKKYGGYVDLEQVTQCQQQ